jgi:hypothetical protein
LNPGFPVSIRQIAFLRRLFAVVLFLSTALFSAAPALRPQPASQSSVSALIAKNKLLEAEKQLWAVLSEHPDQIWALSI